jgi:phosphate transport system permease protein
MAVKIAVRKLALRRPSTSSIGDWVFGPLAYVCGFLILGIAAYLGYELVAQARPAFSAFGFGFITDKVWNPVTFTFGALPAIYGTLATAVIALIIAVPVSQGAAIFLSELAPPWLRTPASYLIETLAAIPSVIFGLWGLFILVPLVRDPVELFLGKHFHWIPLFDGPPFGVGILSAGIILAIMILPIITSISRDIFMGVPNSQREAMLALGATKWEMISRGVIPYARSGLVGAIILGLGRALGETMAVTMVIGNSFKIGHSVFDPAHTIASAIASQFPEASQGVFIASLIYLALILFVISLVINVIARFLVGTLVQVPGRVRE